MLVNLAAARIKAGYATKKSLVQALNNAGIVVNKNTYNRIEAGSQIADVDTAFAIASFLKSEINIFLTKPTQKMSRKTSNPTPAA